MRFSRRDFLAVAALGSLARGLEAQEEKTKDARRAETKTMALKRPIIICAANGLSYLDEAFEMLKRNMPELKRDEIQSASRLSVRFNYTSSEGAPTMSYLNLPLTWKRE